MNIQWFPGHMAKAVRLIDENLKLVDAVLYVLDARIPAASQNPELSKLISHKPILYILNKADLADPAATAEWIKQFTESGARAILTNAKEKQFVPAALKEIYALCAEKIESRAAKGVKYLPRVMIAGIPNTGKSTLINTMCGSRRAVTGDKPGVTRGKQWVSINGKAELLDTPGVLAPKFGSQLSARRAALAGCVGDKAVDPVELVAALFSDISVMYPNAVSKYGITLTGDFGEDIIAAARALNYTLSGGEPDVERTALRILDDYRKGKLGRMTFERVADC